MYAYIKGILTSAHATFAIVEAGGIGYKMFIPVNMFSRLPQCGSEVCLHTSFIVREQSQALYAFLSPQERDLFEALINVTGIGPKLALSLIGHMSLAEMQSAILGANTAALSRVPGIGKKTAERLIIELRDKAASFAPLDPVSHATNLKSDSESQKIGDAMSALIHLGYNQIAAQKAIKKSLHDLPEGIGLAELITQALKNV